MTFVQEVREELARLTGETAGEAEYEMRGAYLACGGEVFSKRAVVAHRFLSLLKRYPERFGECRSALCEDGRFGGGSVHVLFAQRPPRALPEPETAEHAAALVRGAFLARGSISDPDASYHADISMPDEDSAEEIARAMRLIELPAKISRSRGRWTVYVKSGDAVSEFLGRIGASGAYMKMESARVMKEMRGGVNRQVNCDSANIAKTQRASEKQREAIERIERAIGLEKLPASLGELARLRMENADATLEELGAMCEKPLAKSGANNRMRRILRVDEKLRSLESGNAE